MGILYLNYKRVSVEEKCGYPCTINSLTKKQFDEFNSSILGLGDLSKDGQMSNALAAVFDLEGFTSFCNQIDQHLVVPDYLKSFLEWLFSDLATVFTEDDVDGRVNIWGSLPFMAKFTGDGVLFLWNTDLSGGATGIGNILLELRKVCKSYSTEFFPEISKHHAKVPRRLRVGIARGQIISVGDRSDFVGPCINMASRLQKLGSLSFAASRRGIDPSECFGKISAKEFLLKRVDIRGVGEEEVVLVLKDEFASLPKKESKLFRD